MRPLGCALPPPTSPCRGPAGAPAPGARRTRTRCVGEGSFESGHRALGRPAVVLHWFVTLSTPPCSAVAGPANLARAGAPAAAARSAGLLPPPAASLPPPIAHLPSAHPSTLSTRVAEHGRDRPVPVLPECLLAGLGDRRLYVRRRHPWDASGQRLGTPGPLGTDDPPQELPQGRRGTRAEARDAAKVPLERLLYCGPGPPALACPDAGSIVTSPSARRRRGRRSLRPWTAGCQLPPASDCRSPPCRAGRQGARRPRGRRALVARQGGAPRDRQRGACRTCAPAGQGQPQRLASRRPAFRTGRGHGAAGVTTALTHGLPI